MAAYVNEYSKLDTPEKRYLPRWEVQNRVLYHFDNPGTTAEAYTKDMSCAGACITLGEEPKLNDKVHLTVYLNKNICFDVEGNICWSKKEKKSYLAGVHFSNMTPQTQDLVLSFAFELDRKKLAEHWFQGWDGN